jgi:RNA polymerase sigma factor (sigma-70 family)
MSQEQAAVALTTIGTTSTNLLEGLKKAENRTVWQQFVDRYRPLIFKYACRLGLRDEDAEDAAQQALLAFCTAYRDGKYDREKGRLRTWLFAIARNHIKNVHRQRPDREVQVVDQPDRTAFFDRLGDEDHWEKLWEEEWRQAVLRQCLEEIRQALEAKTVEAFELFAWKGWPAQRVANHLGMSENAVFLAKHKILKRIRELLPQMEEIW